MQTYSIKDIELAWAAGFFDGEGHTRVAYSHKNVPDLRIQISQSSTNIEVLNRFRDAVGVGKVSTWRNTSHSNGICSYFQASSKDARLVIALIYTYLSSEKRQQADEAIAIRDAYERIPKKRNRKISLVEIAK